MPRRVPGFPHTVLTDWARARSLMATTSSLRYGESLTTSTTAMSSTTPIEETVANARVQPSRSSRSVSGAAAAMAPSWPVRPVSWVTIGA